MKPVFEKRMGGSMPSTDDARVERRLMDLLCTVVLLDGQLVFPLFDAVFDDLPRARLATLVNFVQQLYGRPDGVPA